MVRGTQLAIRVEDELLELADAVAKLIGETSVMGETPTRTELLRAAMRRGLEEMRDDLKGKNAPKRKR